MFFDCKELTSLNLLKFFVSNNTLMTNMFSGCQELLEIIISQNIDCSLIKNQLNLDQINPELILD